MDPATLAFPARRQVPGPADDLQSLGLAGQRVDVHGHVLDLAAGDGERMPVDALRSLAAEIDRSRSVDLAAYRATSNFGFRFESHLLVGNGPELFKV